MTLSEDWPGSCEVKSSRVRGVKRKMKKVHNKASDIKMTQEVKMLNVSSSILNLLAWVVLLGGLINWILTYYYSGHKYAMYFFIEALVGFGFCMVTSRSCKALLKSYQGWRKRIADFCGKDIDLIEKISSDRSGAVFCICMFFSCVAIIAGIVYANNTESLVLGIIVLSCYLVSAFWAFVVGNFFSVLCWCEAAGEAELIGLGKFAAQAIDKELLLLASELRQANMLGFEENYLEKYDEYNAEVESVRDAKNRNDWRGAFLALDKAYAILNSAITQLISGARDEIRREIDMGNFNEAILVCDIILKGAKYNTDLYSDINALRSEAITKRERM